MLKGAKILLLDEVTSALDTHNENIAIELINKTRKKYNITVIMITHRMHLNNYADKIIMIQADGNLEQGKHEELINNEKGKYFQLWQDFSKKVKL